MEADSFIVTGILAFLSFYFSALRYITDDQFIIFRYIDNIAFGNGFVYNIGEKVLGSTTPLFTLLGALFKYVFVSIPTPDLMVYVNIVLLSIAGAFFYRLTRNFLSEKLSFVGVLILALSLAKAIPEGMETSLFLLTLFIFLDCLLREKYYTSAVFLSLSILTRPDVGLIAILAFICWFQKQGFKKAFRFSMVSIMVALPWIIFATLYFGSFIPQSLLAKLHTSDIVSIPKIQALKAQLAGMSKLYWGRIFDPENIPLQIVFNLVPYLFLVYFGVRKVMNKDNWILFAIPAVYLIVFGISNPIMWTWYITQLEPFWMLISLAGLSIIFEKTKRIFLKVLIIFLILAGPLFFWMKGLYISNPGKEATFTEFGLYIKNNMHTDDTIGLINIGAIGYYSQANIIDFFGIINDYGSHFYPVQSPCVDKTRMYSVPPSLVMFTKPDWLVLSAKEELPLCFHESRWFKNNYEVVRAENIPNDIIWKLKK